MRKTGATTAAPCGDCTFAQTDEHAVRAAFPDGFHHRGVLLEVAIMSSGDLQSGVLLLQPFRRHVRHAGLGAQQAGILSGSGGNYENYIKPPLSPPGWLFPVVWAVLYLLMAIGMAMVWNADQAHAKPARNLYIVQLVVNLLWPFFFFRWEMWGFAVIWLLLLIALVMVMALRFEQISPKAAYLQIPYLIWLCFAAYLNIAIWLLNR